jgi:hypothetical protein
MFSVTHLARHTGTRPMFGVMLLPHALRKKKGGHGNAQRRRGWTLTLCCQLPAEHAHDQCLSASRTGPLPSPLLPSRTPPLPSPLPSPPLPCPPSTPPLTPSTPSLSPSLPPSRASLCGRQLPAAPKQQRARASGNHCLYLPRPVTFTGFRSETSMRSDGRTAWCRLEASIFACTCVATEGCFFPLFARMYLA